MISSGNSPFSFCDKKWFFIKTLPYEQHPKIYIRVLDYIYAIEKQGKTNRVPAEEVLAKEMGVSRVKIRDVLTQLESAGYIIRKRGSGTTINSYVIKEKARLDIDHSFWQYVIASYGFQVHTTMDKTETIYRPAQFIVDALELSPKKSVYHITTRAFANEKPVVMFEDYFPTSLLEEVGDNFDLFENNIYYFLQEMSDDLLETNIVHVEACLADEILADRMQVDVGYPLLKLDVVCYNQVLKPICLVVEYYNTAIMPLSFQRRILVNKFKREY